MIKKYTKNPPSERGEKKLEPLSSSLYQFNKEREEKNC
jgi:hypothetical protein